MTYAPANDGSHSEVTAQLINGHGESFHHALLKIAMPPASGYTVTGGTLTQVDATADPAICYVEVDAAAFNTTTVMVELDEQVDAPHPPTVASLGVQPNPFNPRTEVTFELRSAGHCRVTVFDVRGRALAVLTDGWHAAGRHTLAWNGTDAHGNALASGPTCWGCTPAATARPGR